MSETAAHSPTEALRALLQTLARLGVSPVALTGGFAFSYWVEPRLTQDFDVCAVVPEDVVEKILARFDGVRAGPERIPTIIRFSLAGWSVDIFPATSEYDRECLSRSESTRFMDVDVRVVTKEDLLIYKLKKLRDDKRKLLQDASDIQMLVAAEPAVDTAYLGRWLPASEVALVLTQDVEKLVSGLKAL